MATTIGSLDLASLKNLRDDLTQYFWFESSASATYGAGVHVTLVPDTTFMSNPTGQNILMNTDGVSIRNGLLPMMTLSNNSLDFNVINTTAGTYTKTATFTATSAQIGQSSGAHSVIDANGQRFYASDGTSRLFSIGKVEVVHAGTTYIQPYLFMGDEITGQNYGGFSVSLGARSSATGGASFASGDSNTASGDVSCAIGDSNDAKGLASMALGYSLIAGYDYQFVCGKWNDNKSEHLFEIGNGNGRANDSNEYSNAFTVDWDGNVNASQNITVNNHTSHIGTMKSYTSDEISCATGRYYQLAYLTLEAGVWMIDYVGYFPTTNTTGIRDTFVTTATSNYNNVTTAPASYGNITRDRRKGENHIIYCKSHFPVDIASTTTFRLIGCQTSGQTNSLTGRMYAVRIN